MVFASGTEALLELRKDCGDLGGGLCVDLCDDGTVLCCRDGFAL